MAKGVFMVRPNSRYDDNPAEKYHFPRQYLKRAQSCVGDFIVYYEPTKVRETRGYFAVARLLRIDPDPRADGMFYGVIEPGSYLDFVNSVPFTDEHGVVERGLLNESGSLSGRAQAAVHPLASDDFVRIVGRGIRRDGSQPEDRIIPGLMDQGDPYDPGMPDLRDPARALSSRIVRDAVFRSAVLGAYGTTCAVTGSHLVNGGGMPEVEAAHIRPVAHDGPDMICNGLALSRTVHWMFDRGLIGLSDQLDIRISRHVNDAESIQKLINPTGRLLPPVQPCFKPHPSFVRWHREHCFKT
jgi:putative restriction endonuclease